MDAHGVAGSGRIPLPQSLEDFLVLLEREFRAVRQEQAFSDQFLQGAADVAEQFGQNFVLAAGRNGEMEVNVQLLKPGSVAVLGGFHLPDQVSQHCQIAGRGAPCAQRSQFCFQEQASLGKIGYIFFCAQAISGEQAPVAELGRLLAHITATPSPHADHPDEGQGLQGLPQSRSSHVEDAAKFRLGRQLIAGLPAPAVDFGGELHRDLLAERGAGDGLQRTNGFLDSRVGLEARHS